MANMLKGKILKLLFLMVISYANMLQVINPEIMFLNLISC